MRDLELGQLVRALRRRLGWRQADCASRAAVHRSSWSNLERGRVDRMALATLRRCLAVLDVRLDLVPRWRGAAVDRLLDERHATLQAAWLERLQQWGWLVRAEVSYNRYGERGRIDLLAWHPGLRILLVVEIKTEIADLQALLGGLDAKARLAMHAAAGLGWGRPAAVVACLIVADSSANRDRIRRVGALFSSFDLRGRAAASWLRRPAGAVTGLLLFSDLRPANGSRAKSLSSHRVRRQGPIPRSGASSDARPPPPAPT